MNARRRISITLLISFALLSALAMPVSAKGLTGSFYTTTSGCEAGNITQFAATGDVYLDSGNAKGSKLPDGSYYVQVTEPDGALLGKSTAAPVDIKDGNLAACYNLRDIVVKASNSEPGFDETLNPGGVYKVWLSPDADFTRAKTHNFKIVTAKPNSEQDDVKPGKGDNNGKGNGRDLPGATGWRIRIQNSFNRLRGWLSALLLGADVSSGQSSFYQECQIHYSRFRSSSGSGTHCRLLINSQIRT